MLKECIYPIAVAYGSSSKSGFSFLLPGREVIIQGAKKIIPMVLQQCNGYKTTEEIISSVSQTRDCRSEDVRRLIKIMLAREIIIDVRNYYRLFHEFSVNPSLFFNDVLEEELADWLGCFTIQPYYFNIKQCARI